MKNTHCQDPRCWILLLMANSNYRWGSTWHWTLTQYSLPGPMFFVVVVVFVSSDHYFFYICCIYKIVCLKGKPTLNNWTGCPLKSPLLEKSTYTWFRQTVGYQAPPPCIPPFQKIEAVNGRGLTTFKRQGLKKLNVLLISIWKPLPKPDFSLLDGVTL